METSRPLSLNDHPEGSRHTEYTRPDDGRRSPYDDSGWLAQEAARTDAERRREEQRRRDEARYSMRSVETQPPRLQIDTGNKRREDVLAGARRAAHPQLRDSTYYNREGTPSEPLTPVSAEEKRREHEEFRKHEDLRRRDEQDDIRRRRRREQEGILKRQEEAEFAAREARRSVVPSSMPERSASSSQRSSFADPQPFEDVAPLLMPLESPTRSASTNVEYLSFLTCSYRNHAVTPTHLKP
jgi:STAM-binding protein